MAGVSIIIPTRNRCERLPRAVESARLAGSNVEIVVVDDASEDSTREICQELSGIRYIRARARLGVGGARNVGIVASNCEYISFLDDDDVRLPGSINAQVALLEARPDAGMIYGQALYGDQEGRPQGDFYPKECPEGDIFWQLMRWNFVPCPSVVFRRACLLRVGLLDEAAVAIEDWDLWIRIAELYPVLATKQAVAVWRKPTGASGQFTSRTPPMHERIFRWHKEKWMRLPRALAADANRRREIARGFADRATQQLIWEAASRLKTRELAEVVRIASCIVRLYPLTAVRKTFRASTWSFALNRLRQMPREAIEN